MLRAPPGSASSTCDRLHQAGSTWNLMFVGSISFDPIPSRSKGCTASPQWPVDYLALLGSNLGKSPTLLQIESVANGPFSTCKELRFERSNFDKMHHHFAQAWCPALKTGLHTVSDSSCLADMAKAIPHWGCKSVANRPCESPNAKNAPTR